MHGFLIAAILDRWATATAWYFALEGRVRRVIHSQSKAEGSNHTNEDSDEVEFEEALEDGHQEAQVDEPETQLAIFLMVVDLLKYFLFCIPTYL